MKEQCEKMNFPTGSPGHFNPTQWERCLKTSFDNRHPVTQNISTYSDDVFREMVFGQLRLTLSSVKIKSFKSTKEGLLMKADFTIKNDSSLDIRDITVTCTHYAKSGTKINSNTMTINDSIMAGKSKTFKKFNMGFNHSQANSSSCAITDLKVD